MQKWLIFLYLPNLPGLLSQLLLKSSVSVIDFTSCLYRKMLHQKSSQGIRFYWRLMWKSKKPNCYRKTCIPDFLLLQMKMHVSAIFFNSIIELFFCGKKANGKYYSVSWQAAELGPRAHQGWEQSQMQNLEKCLAAKSSSQGKNYASREEGARFESAPLDSRMHTTNCPSRLPFHLR